MDIELPKESPDMCLRRGWGDMKALTKFCISEGAFPD